MTSPLCVVVNNQFRDQLVEFDERLTAEPNARAVFQPYTDNHLRQVHEVAKPLPVYFVVGHFGEKAVATGILHAAEYREDLSLEDIADVRRLISKYDKKKVYAANLLFVSRVKMRPVGIPLSSFLKRSDGTPLRPGRSPAVVCYAPRGAPHAESSDQAQDESLAGIEGRLRLQFVRHRSREAKLRKAKIADVMRKKGTLACEISGCRFNFLLEYGAIGEGYAQVHHLDPLGRRKAPSQTPLARLAIVCGNCHAMIHYRGECRSLREIAAAMADARSSRPAA